MPHLPKTFAFELGEVWATVTPLGHTIIEWRLNKDYRFEGTSLVFYIEYAYAVDGWTRLNPDEPVVNECIYVDTNQYRCAVSNDVYYRVVAYDGIREYNSRPISTLGVLTERDWLIVRDVVRKEYLRLKKYVGTFGYLLKRREHGIPCHVCLEYDVEEVVDSRCPVCYGTGIIGGYYNALPYWVDQSGTTTRKDVKQPLGMVDNKVRVTRTVAYPRLDTYDMWVDGDKNKRYKFREVSSEVELKGTPIVYISKMHEIPAANIEYEVPLEQDLSIYDPPGAPEKTPLGWRRGITFQEG